MNLKFPEKTEIAKSHKSLQKRDRHFLPKRKNLDIFLFTCRMADNLNELTYLIQK